MPSDDNQRQQQAQQAQPDPVLTDDDLLEGSLDDLNDKVEKAYGTRLDKAIEDYRKEHPEPKAPPVVPEDVLKEFACFSSEDEDVREAAESMLERELEKLPDNAGTEKVREACDRVSKRIARLVESKDAKTADGDPYRNGPVRTGGGGAAAAHINTPPPSSIDEAYELSAKIAASYEGARK
jgi:hypothetical protein